MQLQGTQELGVASGRGPSWSGPAQCWTPCRTSPAGRGELGPRREGLARVLGVGYCTT